MEADSSVQIACLYPFTWLPRNLFTTFRLLTTSRMNVHCSYSLPRCRDTRLDGMNECYPRMGLSMSKQSIKRAAHAREDKNPPNEKQKTVSRE